MLHHSGLCKWCRVATGFKDVASQRALEVSDRTRLQRCHVATGFRGAGSYRALLMVPCSNGPQRCHIVASFRGVGSYRALKVPCSNRLQRCRVATGFRGAESYGTLEVLCRNGLCKGFVKLLSFVHNVNELGLFIEMI